MDIMKLIKKNSAMLLPAGITVAAVLVFVPTWLLDSSITNAMQESVSLGDKIKALNSKAVSGKQWEEEQKYQNQHEADSNLVEQAALATSQRELLAYNIFPDNNETSSAIYTAFGKAYRQAIDDLVLSIKGRDCPSEDEIREQTKAAGVSLSAAGYGSSANANDLIVDQICKVRASSIPVYATPESFAAYTFWNDYNYQGKDKAIEDCWKSQIAYWVQKDVVDTIASMDKNSAAVATSPVKRLIGISFNREFRSDLQPSTDTAGILPAYLQSAQQGSQQTPGSVLSAAWTGRSGNDEIEVVHFAFSVVVSAKSVLPFMRELCSSKPHTFKGWDGTGAEKTFAHNQITILKSSMGPVVQSTSMAGMMTSGQSNNTGKYRYGDDPVVQFDLVCEYVFDKAGYAAIRPKLESANAAATMNAAPSAPRSAPRHSSGSSGGGSRGRRSIGED
jgi:hypothetical protein